MPPRDGSVHSLNHIVFRRSSDASGQELDADLSCIQGKVLQLRLPTHLEDISSTRIRENIDYGRDISNLIDPVVQDFIYRNSLYLREPQYKQIIRASFLEFSYLEHPDAAQRAALADAVPDSRGRPADIDPQDSMCVLRENGPRSRVLGFVTMRTIHSGGLFEAFGSEQLANCVRNRTSGHIQLLTGLYMVRSPGGSYDVGQLLLTEALSRAMQSDCMYAVWYSSAPTTSMQTLDLLQRQGFVRAESEAAHPLLVVDMRSPAVLLQNIPTTLKEPFSSCLLYTSRCV